MKKITILCVILVVVLLAGCKDKKNTNDTNSDIVITPGISDSIFDEDGVKDNFDAQTPPSADTTIPSGDENTNFNPQNPKDCTYEEFVNMTPTQQEACMKAYSSMEEFFKWYTKAKEEYEKEHPSIDVGDGSLDLDEILK